MNKNPLRPFLASAAILAYLTTTATGANVFNMPPGQTSVQFVTIGDPGNAPDATGYGSVGYVYQMDKYDVTTAQYTQFLNAVAATDTYGLFNSGMATEFPNIWGVSLGIAQSGSSGSYTYSVIGNGNVPVFDASWGDAARFDNWLQNGQPTGAEGTGTTETGAYTLNGAVSNAALMAITRNGDALYFIPTENEWYKSAYYKGGGANAGYWTYATQSDTVPSNALSAIGTNNANYYIGGGGSGYTDLTSPLTPVGAFASSPSAYGTYDQSGDISQWNETNITESFASRGVRGGNWNSYSPSMIFRGSEEPTDNSDPTIGFRVASVANVPEPGSFILLAIGALGLLTWLQYQRSPCRR